MAPNTLSPVPRSMFHVLGLIKALIWSQLKILLGSVHRPTVDCLSEGGGRGRGHVGRQVEPACTVPLISEQGPNVAIGLVSVELLYLWRVDEHGCRLQFKYMFYVFRIFSYIRLQLASAATIQILITIFNF